MIVIRRILFFSLISLFLSTCKTPSIIATQSMIEGNMANNLNHYDEAIQHYEQYLKASSQLGLYRDLSEEARVCRSLAHAYATQGKYTHAQQYLKKALAKDSIALNSLETIEDYRSLGELYAYKSEYDQSLHFLMKALQQNDKMETSTKNVNRVSVAATNLTLAQVHLSIGNFNEAESFSYKALALYTTSTHDPAGEMEAKLILGIIAREKNNLSLAETQLKETLRLCEKHHYNSSRQNQALSEVYWLRGDIENTIRFKLLALEQAQKTNIKPQIIMAYMRIGDVYQKLGDQKKASFYYEKAITFETKDEASAFNTSLKIRMGDVQGALDSYSTSGPSLGKALVSLRLGDICLQKNIADSALYFYMQAHTLFEKMNSQEGLANAKLQLSKGHFLKKDYERSRILLKEARSISIQPDVHWQIYYRMGIVDEATNRIDSARVNYKKAISIIDALRANITVDEFKTLFANTKVEVYDKMIQLLLKNRNRWTNQQIPIVEEAFYLSEQSRSRAFLDMMGNHRIDAKSVTDSVLLEKEQQLRLKMQQLSKELTVTNDNAIHQQLSRSLTITQEEHAQIAQRIKLNNPDYATMVSVEPQKVSNLQKELDAKTALLEYWVGDENTIIWIITQKAIQAKVVSITKKALLREVQGCRSAIAQQAEDLTNKTLTGLFKTLIQPTLGDLKDINKLVIIPHASLHFLPFQALQSTNKKFLIEDYIVSYAPSASVFYNCLKKNPQMQSDMLAMALGDQAIGDFEGLPGTEMELKQIGKVYDDKFNNRVGKEFTETYFKQTSSKYGFIHLATHGALNIHQPLYSYLLMYPSVQDDGRLTVEEIFGMDIHGKLVTLSACETGLGELGQGDDLVGLSRAFMYAGAPAVIVSLWKVEDATTAWLMTRFHQYLSSGQSTAEALTFAQRDLLNLNSVLVKPAVRGIKNVEFDQKIIDAIRQRKGSAARTPFYWSPFVLIGSNQ